MAARPTRRRPSLRPSAVGRQGGAGGTGGDVSVTASGTVTTAGADAEAIFAQSVGGGGGNGGSATAVIFDQSLGAALAVGGTGGTGNTGGAVGVSATADLTTSGARSSGIRAQSVGGGGGIGGWVVGAQTQILTARDNGSMSGVVTVGGSGGTGSTGGNVSVDSAGRIVTGGDLSYGIEAASIGGGGGDGGLVFNTVLSRSTSSTRLTVAVGGAGGDGGTGGAVTVGNTGVITTTGRAATGIRARSIGGGGGDASLIASLNLAQVSAGASAIQAGISIGGTGGTGGTGSAVTVTNAAGASIETQGEDAHGIHAVSIGGGGGGGSAITSLSVSAGGSASGPNNFIGTLAIGGAGGTGNTSGDVTVTNAGRIETSGDRSDGIRAQSIAGGGGNGGVVLTASIVTGAGAATPGVPRTPTLSIGGSGGTGSDAGDVVVTNAGTIVTTGRSAHAIHAQSIGGGGGNANIALSAGTGNFGLESVIANALSVGLGALRSADGGMGGDVTVTHSGDITVSGEGAQAIVAESINGGGGGVVLDLNGITGLPGGAGLPGLPLLPGGAPSFTTEEPAFVLVSGSTGADGGPAGTVTVETTGTIVAQGVGSGGARLQAVGGGGGDTLLLLRTEAIGADRAAIGGQVTLGGTDGSGNVGGTIAGTHDGTIGTEGDASVGVLAQSVGSGGGRTALALDTTAGEVGALSGDLGATNGTGGTGGDVSYEQTGQVTTEGELSFGVLAQSVGGGGGLLSQTDGPQAAPPPPPAAMTFARFASFARSSAPATRMAASAALMAAPAPAPRAATFTGSLGANGATGAGGGDVDLMRSGDISTTGVAAVGLLAQSIGGGGGVLALSRGTMAETTLGGGGGATGDGGSVSVANDGTVRTTGAGAHGIVAQSVGGGGGLVFGGADGSTGTARAGGAGDGGAVSLTQTGAVDAQGEDAIAVFAQSVGGGGGLATASGFVGSAGGTGDAGTVDLTLDGDVLAMGTGGTAVAARSDAGAGGTGDDIAVGTQAGRTVLGGAGGTGVAFAGGATNVLTNAASLGTVEMIDGLAFSGTTGDDQAVNLGFVIGDVKLGTGRNGFDNSISTARFEAGEEINLGAATNMLRNSGELAVGSTGRIETVQTSALSGSLDQKSSGVFEGDLDFVAGNAVVGQIDRVDATGAQTYAGTFALTIVNPNAASPGSRDATFATGPAGVDIDALALDAPMSAVAEYELISPTATSAALRYDIDFSPEGDFTRNQTEVGDFINRLQIAGGTPALGPLVGALFVIPTDAELAFAYDQLTAEPYATTIATTLSFANQSLGSALDCRGTAGGTVTANGNCAWAQVGGQNAFASQSGENFAYDLSGGRIQVGVISRFEDDLAFGLFAGRETLRGSIGTASVDDGKITQVGAVARYRMGAAILSGTLSFGRASYDVTRPVALPDGLGGVARSTQRLTFGVAKARVERPYAMTWGRLTPSLDLDVAVVKQRNVEEEGGGLGRLRIEGRSDTHVFLSPAVTFANTYGSGRTTYTPSARIGLTHRLSDDVATSAGLAEAPRGIRAFESFAGIGDRTTLDLDVGMDIRIGTTQNFRVGASAKIGESIRNREINLSYQLKF